MGSQIGVSGHGGRAGTLVRSLGTFVVLAILGSTAAMRPAPASAQMSFVVAGHVGSSPAAPGHAMVDVGTEVRDGLWGVRLGVGTDAASTVLAPLASSDGASAAWTSDVDLGLNLGRVPYASAVLGPADPTLFLGAGGAGVSATDSESGATSRSVVPTWSLGARGGYPITRWLGVEVEARRRAVLGDAVAEELPSQRGWVYRAGLALRFGGAVSAPLLPVPTPALAEVERTPAIAAQPMEPILVSADADTDRGDDAVAIASRAIETAGQFVGAPYRWGGTTPSGFDCSGFVQYVYRQHGIELPRVSRDQARAGRAMPTSLENLAPGDLLFFAQGGPTVDHVAIYAGDGRIVHSSRSGYGVRYDDLSGARGRYYAQHLVAVRRVIEGTELVTVDGAALPVGVLPADASLEALEAEINDAAPPPDSGR